jgi:hypothetical protein
MKKLAGLLAFAVALACAILITQYYTKKPAPPAQPPPDMPPVSAVPAPPAPPPADMKAVIFFEPKLFTLDLASKKASVTLSLGHAPSATPERVWVWAYFFTQETAGKYCEGGPVEVKKPFDTAGARVTVEFPVANCPVPRTPSTTFYARVNVSAESAFAARLTEQRISYDISQASPVTLKGAGK